MVSDTVTLPTKCNLCPRACGANRAQGQAGFCGADDTLVVARAARHMWEEPPISAGKGSGTVFFSHCSLRCIYCQNARIAHEGFGTAIDVDRLARIFLELQAEGAVNINLVTPTHYIVQIAAALSRAKTQGLSIPVVYNTSGYEQPFVVKDLCSDIDVYLADFKYARSGDSDAAERYSHAPDYFEVATRAIDAMVEVAGRPAMGVLADGWYVLRSGVLVRHMMLPGRLDDSKKVMRHLWSRYGRSVLYSVMNQYTPMGRFEDARELESPVGRFDYEELLDYCDSLGMSDYYWQAGQAEGTSFIPPFDNTGV